MTYRKSGVDIGRADRWLSQMGSLIRSTHHRDVLEDRGAFAGLLRLPRGKFREPVLVASTDGVGTKLKLARTGADYETIGIDAVAMNANDVLVYGAQPLFFLDYLAVGQLQPTMMSALLRGIVRGCRQSGCALLGGETAQMPGVYRNGDYDVAGFCVGIVERSRLIDGSRVRAGDTIVGLASSGVHANGFSLVRRALSGAQLNRYHQQLMAPTRIYVKPVLRVVPRVRAIAHITGGGLTRRLPSLLAKRRDLRVRLAPGSWPVPTIFRVIQQAGRLSDNEMFGTFNMGVGMALVCRAQDAARVIRQMTRSGIPAWTIGTIERA